MNQFRRMNQYRPGANALIVATFGLMQLSAAPVIGVASTRGTMEVNSASVRGTANVPEGAAIRTNDTTGQIQLQNGVQVLLGQKTFASVYANRVELREGGGQVTANHDYGVEALGYLVEPANKRAVAKVVYDQDRILVTAVNAPLKVSRDGVLLARLDTGTTYFFGQEPTTSDSATSAGKSSGTAKAKTPAKSTAGKTAGTLSNGAKWGLIGGAAAAAGVGIGLGVALSGSDASK